MLGFNVRTLYVSIATDWKKLATSENNRPWQHWKCKHVIKKKKERKPWIINKSNLDLEKNSKTVFRKV